tara:strand:- start:4223 stop:4489 length:267 start_codon:yes stop_codon:yes gene_type:complete
MLRSAVAEDAVSVSLSIPAIIAPAAPLQADAALSADSETDDSAIYLFELLVAARRLAVTRRHKFLAYLIGMAAEEARLLTQGRSAARQ